MTPNDILAFWFQGERDLFRADPWFRKNPEYDAACAQFADATAAARDGAFAEWMATPDGTLALLLLLDQFPRNLYRETQLAFASDARARSVTTAALASGMMRTWTHVERIFVYLPFEHSEHLVDQDVSVALFSELADHMKMPGMRDSAERHRDVIRRFGRFPHRNAALGRANTAEEVAYLAQPGAGF